MIGGSDEGPAGSCFAYSLRRVRCSPDRPPQKLSTHSRLARTNRAHCYRKGPLPAWRSAMKCDLCFFAMTWMSFWQFMAVPASVT